LAATGLIRRKLHGYAEFFQHLHRGAGDIIVKGITQTSAHEEHTVADWTGRGHGDEDRRFRDRRQKKRGEG
jgi:hypothetical protein